MSVEEFSNNHSALEILCPGSEGTSSHEENSPTARRNLIPSSGLPLNDTKESILSPVVENSIHGRQLTPMPRILLPDSQYMGSIKPNMQSQLSPATPLPGTASPSMKRAAQFVASPQKLSEPQFFKKFTSLTNQSYELDDVVILLHPSLQSNIVAKISAIWTESGLPKGEFRRFFKPEETLHGRKPYHGQGELLSSDEFFVAPLENVLEPCVIESFGEFSRRDSFPHNVFYFSPVEFVCNGHILQRHSQFTPNQSERRQQHAQNFSSEILQLSSSNVKKQAILLHPATPASLASSFPPTQPDSQANDFFPPPTVTLVQNAPTSFFSSSPRSKPPVGHNALSDDCGASSASYDADPDNEEEKKYNLVAENDDVRNTAAEKEKAPPQKHVDTMNSFMQKENERTSVKSVPAPPLNCEVENRLEEVSTLNANTDESARRLHSLLDRFRKATDIDQFERERQHQFSSAPSQLQSLSSLSSCNKKRLFPEHLSRANMLTELASLPKKVRSQMSSSQPSRRTCTSSTTSSNTKKNRDRIIAATKKRPCLEFVTFDKTSVDDS